MNTQGHSPELSSAIARNRSRQAKRRASHAKILARWDADERALTMERLLSAIRAFRIEASKPHSEAQASLNAECWADVVSVIAELDAPRS